VLHLSEIPYSRDIGFILALNPENTSEVKKPLKKSDDEEVLDVLAERSPQIKKAVGVLKELSADERARMIYESRQMAEWDLII